LNTGEAKGKGCSSHDSKGRGKCPTCGRSYQESNSEEHAKSDKYPGDQEVVVKSVEPKSSQHSGNQKSSGFADVSKDNNTYEDPETPGKEIANKRKENLLKEKSNSEKSSPKYKNKILDDKTHLDISPADPNVVEKSVESESQTKDDGRKNSPVGPDIDKGAKTSEKKSDIKGYEDHPNVRPNSEKSSSKHKNSSPDDKRRSDKPPSDQKVDEKYVKPESPSTSGSKKGANSPKDPGRRKSGVTWEDLPAEDETSSEKSTQSAK